jgi:hypothetical protein
MPGEKDYGMMKHEKVTSNKNPDHRYWVVFDTGSDSRTT